MGEEEDVSMMYCDDHKVNDEIEKTKRKEGIDEEEEEVKLIGFMDSLDNYLSLMDSLSSTLRQGWLELASARHSMGSSRISSTLFDLSEHSAHTTVNLNHRCKKLHPKKYQMIGRCGDLRRMKNMLWQVLTCQWFTFFASLLILSVSGATYIFGLYSNLIKTSLAYDQTTLNLIGFSKEVGANIGVLSGLINEIAPPWVVLSIGMVMNFFGYFMIWLSVSGHIPKPAVWQMCLYICLGANSQTFSNTGVLVTCVKNFPESRGIVIGLLKGYVGLSGAISEQIYHALYGNDRKALILLIAWLPAAVSFVFLPTVRYMKVNRKANEHTIFYNFLYIALGLGGFLMALIILQNRIRFNKYHYIGSSCIVLVLLFLPLAIVVAEEMKSRKSKARALEIPSEAPTVVTDISLQQIKSRENSEKSVSCLKDVFNPPARGEDYTIPQAIFSVDMLIIFIATIGGSGGLLTAMDNLGQIAKSLGYPSENISTFVSLVSIWGFLGRVVAGFVSEALLTKYQCPRPLLFTVVLFFSCVGHLLIAFPFPYSLYVASVVVGFCFGALWPLIFAMISEIFGLKYYSTLYTVGGLASPIGSYILGVQVAGRLYDEEANKQQRARVLAEGLRQELTCVGGQCYRLPFIIIAITTLFGCFISFILVIRTRKFYKGDIYKKLREEAREDLILKSPKNEGKGSITIVT